MQSQPVAVIVGASSGIGRETALLFAKNGVRVVVAARSKPNLDSLVKEINGDNEDGPQAIGVVCDITDFAQVKRVATKAYEMWGRIDTWIHCAAVVIIARFEDTTEAEYQRIFDVNVFGCCRSIWAALPYLKRTNGTLIVVTSVESKRALPLHSAYSATKHALNGILEALRVELAQEGSKVQVTNIMPSNIDSPIYEHCLVKEENGEYVYAGAPITYTPSLVADTIFFASRHACREIFVGTSGWLVTLAQFLMPGVLDFALSFPIINKLLQRTSKRRKKDQVNLMKPTNDEGGNRAKGSWGALSTSFSIYNTVYKLVVWTRDLVLLRSF